MLVFDLKLIGDKLYEIRNKKFLNRTEVAERAEISDRTYADIERGSTNMRIETLLKICEALNITPNDVLVINNNIEITEQDIAESIKDCSNNEDIQPCRHYRQQYAHAQTSVSAARCFSLLCAGLRLLYYAVDLRRLRLHRGRNLLKAGNF